MEVQAPLVFTERKALGHHGFFTQWSAVVAIEPPVDARYFTFKLARFPGLMRCGMVCWYGTRE